MPTPGEVLFAVVGVVIVAIGILKALRKPKAPPIDWAGTEQYRWVTVKRAGAFKRQHLQRLFVDMDSGAEEWDDCVSVFTARHGKRVVVRRLASIAASDIPTPSDVLMSNRL